MTLSMVREELLYGPRGRFTSLPVQAVQNGVGGEARHTGGYRTRPREYEQRAIGFLERPLLGRE